MTEQQLGRLLIYQNEKGDTRIDVYFEDENIWLTQKSLSDLYQVRVPTINEHIKTILEDGELQAEATIRNFLIVQNEGNRLVERDVLHYNFQMILAIGYRVRSNVGKHFRNWASKVLTEYSKKGFAINDARLKNPKPFGVDYFDELLERIKDIRTSEKRFYEAVKKIYATSIDYDPSSQAAKNFFASVQNKMHYSVHGHTAAELLVERADATKDNMGLKSYEGARVRKGDAGNAKNYLDEKEIQALNHITVMYLDYAEDQARRHIPMHMADWEEKLDGFLTFTGREVLSDLGKVSAEEAKLHVHSQYALYDKHRRKLDESFSTLQETAKRLEADKES